MNIGENHLLFLVNKDNCFITDICTGSFFSQVQTLPLNKMTYFLNNE